MIGTFVAVSNTSADATAVSLDVNHVVAILVETTDDFADLSFPVSLYSSYQIRPKVIYNGPKGRYYKGKGKERIYLGVADNYILDMRLPELREIAANTKPKVHRE